MLPRDALHNPLVASAKRAASSSQLSLASSFEEVRLEDLEHSDFEEDRPQSKAKSSSATAPVTTETNLKPKSSGLPPAPTTKPAEMHMVDSENDLLQPQSKKDITLRELHDPIEGDSANISWRGNHDVKANACKRSQGHLQPLVLFLLVQIPSMLAIMFSAEQDACNVRSPMTVHCEH